MRHLVAAAALLPLTHCAWYGDGFLAPAGPVAQAQRTHFLSIVAWTLIVVLPVFVAVPLVLWRYRMNHGRGRYAPEWEFNLLLEVLIWGIPVAVVIVLSANLWRETQVLDPYKPIPAAMAGDAPLDIQVVAMDWKFLFIYPKQNIASVNALVVPVGRPLRFHLTSESVMQSFVIPRLGGQIYAMAGMVTQLNLLADTPGRYRGENTQYNGEGFAQEKFQTRAVPSAAFENWVTGVQHSNHPLDAQTYAALARRSIVAKPILYSAVPQGLFDQVVVSFTTAPSAAAGTAAVVREVRKEAEVRP